MNYKNIFKTLESDIGLPNGFLHDLYKSDDWTLIIKLHALLETSFTNLLISEFNKPNIDNQIASLALSDSKIGKIVFAKNLKLIRMNEYKFVILLSELRNKLVHNIKNVNFSISDYVVSMDKGQKKRFKNTIYNIFPADYNKLLVGNIEKIIKSPKSYIWTASIFVLARNFGSKIAIEKYKNIEKLHQK